jgi:hypothetical protein
MGVLTSELFTQADPATVKKLEDCATGRPNEVLSHFSQGANARGAHISRVQAALRNVQQLEPDLGIPEFEVNGGYDKAFADAVSIYKERRNIRNYANKIDNIIGVKTIRSLDADAKRRKEEPTPPAPQPATEERVTFRETGATVVITKEPREPGLGGGKLGKLITIFNVAKNIPADLKHIERHPCQAGDIDRDRVRKETKALVQKDHVLTRVSIEHNIVQHQVEVHFGYYEIKVDHTRSYTFIWGTGTADQQVAVTRHTKLMTDRGRVDLDNTDNFFVKQPPNLADP